MISHIIDTGPAVVPLSPAIERKQERVRIHKESDYYLLSMYPGQRDTIVQVYVIAYGLTVPPLGTVNGTVGTVGTRGVTYGIQWQTGWKRWPTWPNLIRINLTNLYGFQSALMLALAMATLGLTLVVLLALFGAYSLAAQFTLKLRHKRAVSRVLKGFAEQDANMAQLAADADAYLKTKADTHSVAALRAKVDSGPDGLSQELSSWLPQHQGPIGDRQLTGFRIDPKNPDHNPRSAAAGERIKVLVDQMRETQAARDQRRVVMGDFYETKALTDMQEPEWLPYQQRLSAAMRVDDLHACTLPDCPRCCITKVSR